MKQNNELVIYELPTQKKDARDIGTFRDTCTLALLKDDDAGTKLASVAVANRRALRAELGINALELLPPMDSKSRGEWRYGQSSPALSGKAKNSR